jgi:micrococcal nuclease
MASDYVFKVLSVVKIVDGDTVDLDVDLGFHVHLTQRFRLLGVSAPEIFRPSSVQEKEQGLQCKDYLARLLSKYATTLYVRSQKTDVYGRYLGDLFAYEADGATVSINKLLSEFISSLANN